MLELILGAIVLYLTGAAWKLVLWPAILVVSTPGVLVYALVAVARHRQHFRYALAEGYSNVSAFWQRWA